VWLTISESEAASPSPTPRTETAGAVAGAVLLAVVLLFALVATGATLGTRHQRVTTATDAARVLQPIAGRFAGDVLGAGLLASALVALPVIMATTAHVLAAQLGWRRGLMCRPREAPGFYGVLAAVAALGVAISYGGLSPVRILYVGSIIGGVGTPVSLVALIAVSGSEQLMRGRQVGRALRAAGWTAAALVSLVSLAYLLQQVGLLS
jgi:Mn2+/Fe2+ NRAMP family transporter